MFFQVPITVTLVLPKEVIHSSIEGLPFFPFGIWDSRKDLIDMIIGCSQGYVIWQSVYQFLQTSNLLFYVSFS